jgi:hypothetical protein
MAHAKLKILFRRGFETGDVATLLRHASSDVNFNDRDGVAADITALLTDPISFLVLRDPSEVTYDRLSAFANATSQSVIIACSVDSAAAQGLLHAVPSSVRSVLFLEPADFERRAAETIWRIISHASSQTNEIESELEERRELFLSADMTARVVLERLIADPEQRAILTELMKTELGTLRRTLHRAFGEFDQIPFAFDEGA